MAADSYFARTIDAINGVLLEIRESQEKILSTKSLLLDIRNQCNDKTTPDTANEELTALKIDFHAACEDLERVLRFYCCFGKSLSGYITLVTRPHFDGDPIRQNCAEMNEKWLEIRLSDGYACALEYNFSFPVERTMHKLLENAPVYYSSTAAIKILGLYQEFLLVLKSSNELVPKPHLERAGSVFVRTFQWLLKRRWDVQQHTSNRA